MSIEQTFNIYGCTRCPTCGFIERYILDDSVVCSECGRIEPITTENIQIDK